MKGSYLLLIELDKDKTISIGKIGKKHFIKGYYVYAGSALNNIEKRILRHLRENKKTHWHIDYLLNSGKIIKAFYKEKNVREECKIAKNLARFLSPISGFGCSDCKCKSHLFYGSYKDIIDVAQNLKMKTYIL